MPEGNYILGIDLGTKKVAALLGRSHNGEVMLCGVGLAASEGMRRGEIIDLEKATASIGRALAQLHPPAAEGAPPPAASAVEGQSLPTMKLPHRAWVGVTGDHIRCFNPRADIAITKSGRPVSPRDIEQVMRAAVGSVALPTGHEVLHVIARTFAIDNTPPALAAKSPAGAALTYRNSIANPVGMPASRLEVQAHVITASSLSLGNLERCIEQAGLGIEGVVLEPLASADAVLSEAERELGVVLIDIGAGTTDIAVFVDGSISFTGAVALGGNHVTRDLAVGLEIDVEEAEALKIARGCALIDLVGNDERVSLNLLSEEAAVQVPRRLLAEIIQPRAAEMLSLAKEQLVKSGYFHRLAVGAVLTGGGSQLEGLLPLAKQVLGLPTRLGRPFAAGPINLKDPRLATGIGLLLYGSHEQVHSTSPSAWAQVKPNLAARLMGWWKHLFGP